VERFPRSRKISLNIREVSGFGICSVCRMALVRKTRKQPRIGLRAGACVQLKEGVDVLGLEQAESGRWILRGFKRHFGCNGGACEKEESQDENSC